MRYFRRFSALHVDGVIGTGGALVPVLPPSIAGTLAQSALSVNAGASVDVLITLARTNTTVAVTPAVSGLPAGASGAFSDSSLTGAELTTTLTVTVAGGAAAVDDAPFEVTLSGPGLTPVVLEATLDINAAPSTGLPAIQIKAMRHDGGTGTARAVGFIPFAPGAVRTTDLANLTAWDANGAEVGVAYEDIGARHLETNVANGLLGAHVQLDTSFAAPASEPAYTLKFDQTRTVTRPALQAYTEWTQTLTVTISGTDATKLHVDAGACHPNDQNAPIPFPAQDATWAYNAALTIPATGFAMLGVRLMLRHATGVVYAYPVVNPNTFNTATNTGTSTANRATAVSAAPSISNVSFWYHDYGTPNYFKNVVGETCLGFVVIYVAAGTGATTIGTAALNGAGITVTTTGSGKEPFSVLPTEMPVASLAPSSPTYLCAAEFGGHKLTPEATQLTMPAPTPAQVPLRRVGSDWVWGRLGWYGWLTNGGFTWYNYALAAWGRYAETGESRYYRRALATQKAYRYLAQISGGYALIAEAGCDIAQPLVTYALAQRPSDSLNVAAAVEVAGARALLKHNEDQEYRSHNAPRLYSTGRFAMHIAQACSWFGRLGVDPGSGYTLNLTTDSQLGAGWQTATTAAAHFGRVCKRVSTAMATDTVHSPGQRYVVQPKYFDHSPWMSGWLWSYIAEGIRTFGIPEDVPGGAPSTIAQDMSDSMTYDFTGLSSVDGKPYYALTPAGDHSFVYSTPGGGSPPAGGLATYTNLSGTSLFAITHLAQTTTGATRALWKARAAELYSGMQRDKDGGTQQYYYNSKDFPEADLLGSGYLAEIAEAV